MQGIDQLLSLEAMNPQMQQAARVIAKVLATEINKALKGDVRQGIDELSSSARDDIEDVFSSLDQQVDVSFSNLRKKTEDWTRQIEEAKKKWGEALKDMNTRLPGVGLGTAVGGMAGQLSSMMGGLGSGAGLIGFFKQGLNAAEQWRAAGGRVALTFKSVGDISAHSGAAVGTFAAQIRQLTADGVASESDFAAVAQSMATNGISLGEALKHVALSGTDFTGNAVRVGVELDAAFSQASGTTMGLAAQFSALTNKHLPDGLQLVTDIGRAAQSMGMSFQVATGAIMQTSSSLRTQMVDARQLGDMMGRMQSYFKGTGMTDRTAGAFSTVALQGVGQSIAGMSDAMKGFLGSKIGNQTGAAAVIDFERGMRGSAGADYFGKTIATIVEQVRGISANPLEQQFALQKLFGMPPETAEAIIGMSKDGADSKTIAERAAQQSTSLLKGLNDKALGTNTFEAAMRNIQNGLDRVSLGLLQVVTTILVGILEGITSILALIATWFATDSETAGRLANKVIIPRLAEHAEALGAGSRNVVGGMEELFKGVGKGAGAAAGFASLRGMGDFQQDIWRHVYNTSEIDVEATSNLNKHTPIIAQKRYNGVSVAEKRERAVVNDGTTSFVVNTKTTTTVTPLNDNGKTEGP